MPPLAARLGGVFVVHDQPGVPDPWSPATKCVRRQAPTSGRPCRLTPAAGIGAGKSWTHSGIPSPAAASATKTAEAIRERVGSGFTNRQYDGTPRTAKG